MELSILTLQRGQVFRNWSSTTHHSPHMIALPDRNSFSNLLLAALALGTVTFLTPASVCAGPVAAMGRNHFGQAAAPAELTNAVSMVAGRDFSFALNADGTAAGWGLNGEGRSTPPANLTNVVALSAGIYHTLALKADGTVTGWGFNGNDILSVPADLTNVLAVAAGGYHSLAVRRDGTVVGWGFRGNGRATAPATLTDVIAVDAGRDHSVALKSDGTVVAWGLNDNGQTEVPAGLNQVIAIAAGENHTLALKQDGTVVAWGQNDSGQCTVPAGLTNVTAIAAGGQHSLALRTDGTVTGWGDNTYGQLNLIGSDIRAIAAGGAHSLAVRGTGPVITTHPRSQTVLAGAAVMFTTAAPGMGLSYQWLFNGQPLPGATNATLSFTAATRLNAGLYAVQVSNASGTERSANAALIVRGLQQLFAPLALGNGALRLTFGDQHGDPISAPNALRYAVEVSADLRTWTPLNLPLLLVDGRLQVDDPVAGSFSRRFYRVVEQ
jgi:hypothetical protein